MYTIILFSILFLCNGCNVFLEANPIKKTLLEALYNNNSTQFRKTLQELSTEKRKEIINQKIIVYTTTMLHYAVEHNFYDIARISLEAGALVNASDFYGRTALHIAAEQNNPNTFHLLLSYGADINIQNGQEHNTPFHIILQNILKNPDLLFQEITLLETLLLTKPKVTLLNVDKESIIHLLARLPIDKICFSSSSTDDYCHSHRTLILQIIKEFASPEILRIKNYLGESVYSIAQKSQNISITTLMLILLQQQIYIKKKRFLLHKKANSCF